MKTAKRLTAIILACIMLMGSLATGASAMTPGLNPIAKVEIEIDRDIAGLTIYDYEKYITIKTPGVVFNEEAIASQGTPFFVRSSNIIYDVLLSDGIAPAGNLSSKMPIMMEPELEANKSYFASLYLLAAEGYFFSENAIVTVNGIAIEDNNQMDEYFLSVDFIFTVGAAHEKSFFEKLADLFAGSTSRVISDVDITVREDFAGLTPADFEEIITVNTKGVELDVNMAARVVCITDGRSMNSDEKFEKGKNYGFMIYFITEDGKVLANRNKLTVTINGEKGRCDGYNEANSRQALVNYAITAESEPQPKQPGANGFFETIQNFFASIAAFFGGLINRQPV